MTEISVAEAIRRAEATLRAAREMEEFGERIAEAVAEATERNWGVLVIGEVPHAEIELSDLVPPKNVYVLPKVAP
jgi:hypothetical protein